MSIASTTDSRRVSKSPANGTRSSVPKAGAAMWAQFVGIVLIATAGAVFLFSSNAGATSLSDGTVALVKAHTNVVAANPLSANQVVGVVVGPNSTLSRSSLEAAGFPSGAVPIKFLQCADQGGLKANLPKSPAGCEPLTLRSTDRIKENGSLFLPQYTVYALPDIADLGSSTTGTTCDDGDHWCVVGVFTNQNDFTKPHIYSPPFQVTTATSATNATNTAGPDASGSGASGTVSPGVSLTPTTLAYTGTPTIWPWLLGSGLVLVAVGTGLRMRKRRVQG